MTEDLVTHVDRLALTTGKDPVPERKRQWGYRCERDKFGIAGAFADTRWSYRLRLNWLFRRFHDPRG